MLTVAAINTTAIYSIQVLCIRIQMFNLRTKHVSTLVECILHSKTKCGVFRDFDQWRVTNGGMALPQRGNLQEKTKGSVSCPLLEMSPCGDDRLTAAVNGFLQFGSGDELGDFLCRNFQRRAGLRISPSACLARADRERAESNQSDFAAFLQRTDDSVDR